MLRARPGGSRMSKRRKFSAGEKYRIIEEARQPGVSTAEVCRRHGIAASVFYRWEAQMREGAKEGLADKRGRKEKAAAAEIERLQAELARKNDVIAELTEALIEGKRGSRTIRGHSDPGSGEGGDRELRARGQRARRTPTAAGLSRSGPWLEPLSALVLAGGGRRGSGRRPRWRPPVGPSVARGTRSGYQVLAGGSKGRLPAAGLADGTSR